jgi:hypothetical protein
VIAHLTLNKKSMGQMGHSAKWPTRDSFGDRSVGRSGGHRTCCQQQWCLWS